MIEKSDNYIRLDDLANELHMTRQALNHNLQLGRAGDVQKEGEGKTCTYLVTAENAFILTKWLLSYGRSLNKKAIRNARNKYKEMMEQNEPNSN